MSPSPITIFVYNRPEHTRRTVETLTKNHLAGESELFIFSDGPKNDVGREKVEEVRKYIRTITGFKRVEVIERAGNFGLAKSIISGVTDIVNRYGSVIVLEDDLITSPYFLQYMNDALLLYKDAENVISIHGYVYPIKKTLPETFFLKGADCWGWATWKRGWDKFEPNGTKLLAQLEERHLTQTFDFNDSYPYTNMLKRQIAGTNDSWAVRWYASAFLADMLTLYPGRSLVQNIGHDLSGAHSGDSIRYDTPLATRPVQVERIACQENIEARNNIGNFLRSLKPNFFTRLKKKLWH